MALAGDIGSGTLVFQLGFCSNRKAASSLRCTSFHAASIMSGGYCGLESLNVVYARLPSSSVDESGEFQMRRSELEGVFKGVSESSGDDPTRRRWAVLGGGLRVDGIRRLWTSVDALARMGVVGRAVHRG